jgi:hypothetical protein
MFWAADGPGGGPGTLLRRVTGLVANGVTTGETFYRVDLSNLQVATNKVYVGPEWNGSLDQDFFVCADENGPGGARGFAGLGTDPPILELGVNAVLDYEALGVRIETGGGGGNTPPPGPWLTTSALPGYRFKGLISGDRAATQVTDCAPETLCIAGAIPARTEAFVRIIGPRPNGFLWPQVIRFTTAQLELWIEKTSGGHVNYYKLDAVSQDSDVLNGLVDREGFVAGSLVLAGAERGAATDLPLIDSLVDLRSLQAKEDHGARGDEDRAEPMSGTIVTTYRLNGDPEGAGELTLRQDGDATLSTGDLKATDGTYNGTVAGNPFTLTVAGNKVTSWTAKNLVCPSFTIIEAGTSTSCSIAGNNSFTCGNLGCSLAGNTRISGSFSGSSVARTLDGDFQPFGACCMLRNLPFIATREGAPVGDPLPPPGPWLTTSGLPGYRFKGLISGDRAATQVTDCVPETLCIAGAIPTRTEAFVRIIGPRPNGFLWPQLIRFTTAQLELWIEQTSSGEVSYYKLDAVSQDSDVLNGVVDREGFLP